MKPETTDIPLKRLCKLFRVVPHGKYGQALNKELQAAFGAGYAEGHEDQMKARILDAQEARRVKS